MAIPTVTPNGRNKVITVNLIKSNTAKTKEENFAKFANHPIHEISPQKYNYKAGLFDQFRAELLEYGVEDQNSQKEKSISIASEMSVKVIVSTSNCASFDKIHGILSAKREISLAYFT